VSEYAVAHLDEIDELDDGRCPYRPVRHHFGITAFGMTAWTARDAGDRIINEHDESDDGQEELYLVQRGHAAFELDGKRLDAPAGTFVYVPSGVKRTAFAEESGTTILAVGGVPGKAYEPAGWEIWAQVSPLRGRSVRRCGRPWAGVDRGPIPSTPSPCTTSPAARASPAGRATRSSISGKRSIGPSGSVPTRRRIRTSIRSGMSRRSRSWPALERVCVRRYARRASLVLEGRRPLVDAPQHRHLPVQIVAALELPFVPPSGTGVGQCCDRVACLGRVGRAGSAEDDLERGLGPPLAVLPDVRDQVTDLVDGWDVPVPGGGEQGNHAVPACRTAHGSAVWPESSDPDRRSRPLYRRGQQGDIPDVVVAPMVVHSLARPVASHQFQAFIEALGQQDRVGCVPKTAELVLDRPAEAPRRRSPFHR
jgi:hypothetical protein